jgi:hypothetical protein
MSDRFEWDYPPTMRQRRRRPAPVLEGEVLSSVIEPRQPRTVRFERPRDVRVPKWAVALLAFGVLAMMFPFGLVVGVVILAILALMYPAQAFIAFVSLIVAIALIVADKRRRRRRFAH